MFDITSSKLFLLGIVILLVVGPKDLPLLLRTIGKYVGIIRRQAAEFRAQFDEAMREAELEQIKKEVENIGREAEASIVEAQTTVEKEIAEAKADVDKAMSSEAGEHEGEAYSQPASGPPAKDADANKVSETAVAGGGLAQSEKTGT
jgi:sec-independent protein translocase protein TatB